METSDVFLLQVSSFASHRKQLPLKIIFLVFSQRRQAHSHNRLSYLKQKIYPALNNQQEKEYHSASFKTAFFLKIRIANAGSVDSNDS